MLYDLPEGFTLTKLPYKTGIDSPVEVEVLKYKRGHITINWTARIWQLGHTVPFFQSRILPGHGGRGYEARGWRKKLLEDAVACLRGIYDTHDETGPGE